MALITSYYNKIPAGSRVLEMGCGPGRTLVPGLTRQLQMTGIDVDADMVRVARKRVEGLEGSCTVIHGDFLDFRATAPFSLVLCVQNTLLMVRGANKRRGLFQIAFDSLEPGGCFIVWILSDHPWGDGRRVSLSTPRGELEFSSRVEAGAVAGQRAIIYDLALHDAGLHEQTRIDMELLRWDELLALGANAGFEIAEAFGDIGGKSPLDAHARMPTVVFRRPLI